MNLRSAAAEKKKQKKRMFPRQQGGNPAGVYDKYDLHNKARLWEKDHTAHSAAGNTFSFIKNRGRAKYYWGVGRGVRAGWAVFVAARNRRICRRAWTTVCHLSQYPSRKAGHIHGQHF